MPKVNDTIEEIAYEHKKLRDDTRIIKAGARTVEEVLDTMRKHPGTKMNDVLRKMAGH